MRMRSRENGFSLLEMMIGVSLVGVALIATVPNVQSYRNSQRVAAASDQVGSLIRSAQARARSMNQNVVVIYQTDQVILVDDENGNGSFDAGENETTHPLPDGVSVAGTTFAANSLVFNPRGRALTGGTLEVAGPHTQNKEVRVSVGTGHIKISTKEDG